MTRKSKYVRKQVNKLNQIQAEWIKQEYLPYLDRKGLKQSTQDNYLQCVIGVLENEEFNPYELTNDGIEALSKKVASNVQSSEYKKSGGEFSKRRKQMIWKSFKDIIKIQGLDENEIIDFKAKSKGNVRKQVKTEPEGMPNPQQTREFLQAIGEVSGESHRERNRALIALMWDVGPRIGEALNIQMKDIEQKTDGSLEIFIEGNKKSKDRTVNIFQGRKIIKDFYKNHPGKDDDYLFSNLKHNKLDKPVDSSKFRKKIKETKRKKQFDITLFGEPNHVWRKAMVTSHGVNEWATWEEICKVQGKKPDSTKPDYWKMAMSDVNKSRGQKIGAIDEDDVEKDSHMLGKQLLPQKCVACGKVNKCFLENCEYCSGNLKTPDRSAFQKDQDEEKGLSTDARNALQKLKEKGLLEDL